MPRVGLAKIAVALGLFALSGCTCQNIVGEKRFSCKAADDCAEGFVCRGGECRKNDIPAGACFAGETRANCSSSGCAAACGDDGGFQPCAPISGGPFDTNPSHCGECGVQCSTRLGNLLGCIDNRCACSSDQDCTSDRVCNIGGVCVPFDDNCARQRCNPGEVCRLGACGPVACSQGCGPGEVCDTGSNNCRPISSCRLPKACVPSELGGTCEGDPKPDGELCDDGVACTFGDSCVAGTCTGSAYTCPPPAACQVSVACAGDGGCAVVALPDGTGCDDGNPCTYAEACASGTCSGTAYTCSPSVCASASVCAGDGGCINTPRNEGLACDDTVACSHTDTCDDAGTCVGVAYSCPLITECRLAGICIGDGGCNVVDKANGTACDAGFGCSSGDTCTTGVCNVGTALTSYQDLDGDGRGNANITMQVCPLPANFVVTAGDCNDGSPNVYAVMAAVQDVDQDGVTVATTLNPTACVGPAMTVNGRTYYRDASGAYTWLAAASATADCNDADADVFNSRNSMVTDADHEGYYTGAIITPACVGASQVFNTRTYYANTAGAFVYLDSAAATGAGDCNDANAVVYRTVASLYTDSDQDGWTLGAAAPQCVGLNTTIGGRTYYQNTAAQYVYGATSLGTDCNDGSNAILGATNWYVDADADSFGTGAPSFLCTAPGGQVSNNTDCNDGNMSIHTARNVYQDADQDGWTAAAPPQGIQCTGNSSVINGRTYYRDGSANFSWVGASLGVDCADGNNVVQGPINWYLDADGDGFGLFTDFVVACAAPTPPPVRVSNSTDCNDANINLFAPQSNVVVDNDRDGYPPDNTQTSPCAGATSTVGGRTYYSNGAGGYWMPRANCINVSGVNCTAPFDCYDSNNNANPVQTSYFTSNRGDGSFDYNCSGGTVTTNPASGTYCTSLSSTTFFSDAACGTVTGVTNRCLTPTAFVSTTSAACGRQTQGTSGFYNPGVCTAATRASGTVIGCR